jgi:hypothetical protein
MWEKGRCSRDQGYALYRDDGKKAVMESRVTAFWPDGSVKWTAHTAEAGELTERIWVEPEVGTGDGTEAEAAVLNGEFALDLGRVRLEGETGGEFLFRSLKFDGREVLRDAAPVLILEEPVTMEGCRGRLEREYRARVESAQAVQSGPVTAVLRFEGTHVGQKGDSGFPFIIYMTVEKKSGKLRFVHTFFYDGDEDKDFLKGLGICFGVPMTGPFYNRHVKVEGDRGCFHEAAAQLLTWKPKVSPKLYERQMNGEVLRPEGQDREDVGQVLEAMPFWDIYHICQDSGNHFSVRKKVRDINCCYLSGLEGKHLGGSAALGSESGSVIFSMRDIWEKYPSGYTFSGITEDVAQAAVWLWPPNARPMDYRHYANRGYNQTYYEGYDFKGADPEGIGCTSEFALMFSDRMIPSDGELEEFSREVNYPAQYVGTPEDYHRLHAFGRWSLPSAATQTERWLEEQLDRAVEFYKKEVEVRGWYGMYDYGDFMHTYDKDRHCWRYDMGGYAWDNTELVPTLWLWLYFMRTGREDVFALAEKLSRHASEVDVYHFGPYKGMGSRHNVRHWGCPCKEARIAMAAHHRFFYYMTGDWRMGEIFEELKDNERAFLNKDPLEAFYDKDHMVYPSHARSGPDWSSLCANWMTRWERFGDERYRQKIVTGIQDIGKAPLKLVSGPDFEFDPVTCHLRYIGEQGAGGTHLQVCMGAPQIWIELEELLKDETWKQMLAEYGRFYFLPREKQIEESRGLIGDREFSLPMMAASMGAYGAMCLEDEGLARAVWKCLLGALMKEGSREGFETVAVKNQGNQAVLEEIPWISTNFAAQWCLNVITSLEFIREDLPETLDEAQSLAEDMDGKGFRRA